MSSNPKIWYSFQEGKSEDSDVGFYNKKDFKWVEPLESNYKVIKQEVSNYISTKEDRIKPYFNKRLVEKENSWLASGFLIWGWKVKKNIQECPQIESIINSIPNAVSASISILEPGAEIKPHRGDTNAIFRAHLGLEVPYGLPDCGLRVVQTDVSWEEGRVLVFNDAAWHKAWNKTDKRRYVLLVDIIRPEFERKKYWICSKVLGRLIMQSVFQKIRVLKHLPKIGRVFLLYSIILFMNPILRIKNFLYI